MKQNIFIAFVLIFFAVSNAAAQTPIPAEIPRNYKPKPQPLLPMPDSLTDEKVFPVLGQYEVSNSKGDPMNVNISKDSINNGIIWVSGLPQGKFKAYLKAPPGVYKIFSQNAITNDNQSFIQDIETENKASSRTGSGKLIGEGTLIFDSGLNKIYINLGGKYNENQPSAIFPELNTFATDSIASTSPETKKAVRKNKFQNKGLSYTGTKLISTKAHPQSN